MAYFYLALAIIFEVIGTLSLKASSGMEKLWPSVIVMITYSLCFYFMSLSFKTLSVGFVYAVWAGLGTLFITILGIIIYKEKADFAGFLGIGLILLGVIILNAFSKMSHH